MKIFNGVMLLLFLLSAGLQYNDPDPLRWISIYLFAALLCLLAARGSFNGYLYLAGAVFCSAYALFLFFAGDGVVSWWQEHDAENIAQSMKATKPWIEQTREFGGLLIILFSLALNWFYFRRRSAPRPA